MVVQRDHILYYNSHIRGVQFPRVLIAVIIFASSLAATIVLFALVNVYDPFGGPVAFFLGLIPIVICFFISMSLGLIARRIKWMGVVGLALISLSPSLFFSSCTLIGSLRTHRNGPINHFKEYLAADIPSSVSDLEFVPPGERRDGSPTLRFTIGRADLDQIIEAQKFLPISRGDMPNPRDTFRDPSYLRLGANDQLYQAPAKSNWGRYTLLVNENHTSVIFRYEDEAVVRDQDGPANSKKHDTGTSINAINRSHKSAPHRDL